MTWLLTASRWLLVLLVSALAGLAAGLLHGETASMPNLSSGSLSPVPVVAAVALTPPMMLIWGWSRLPLSMLATSTRAVGGLLVVSVLGALTSYGLAAWISGSPGAAVESVRNAGGLFGIALLGQWLWGERGAALLPIGYLLAAFSLGRPGGSPDPATWAWVLVDGSGGVSLAVASLLLVVGLVLVPSLPRAAARNP